MSTKCSSDNQITDFCLDSKCAFAAVRCSVSSCISCENHNHKNCYHRCPLEKIRKDIQKKKESYDTVIESIKLMIRPFVKLIDQINSMQLMNQQNQLLEWIKRKQFSQIKPKFLNHIIQKLKNRPQYKIEEIPPTLSNKRIELTNELNKIFIQVSKIMNSSQQIKQTSQDLHQQNIIQATKKKVLQFSINYSSPQIQKFVQSENQNCNIINLRLKEQNTQQKPRWHLALFQPPLKDLSKQINHHFNFKTKNLNRNQNKTFVCYGICSRKKVQNNGFRMKVQDKGYIMTNKPYQEIKYYILYPRDLKYQNQNQQISIFQQSVEIIYNGSQNEITFYWTNYWSPSKKTPMTYPLQQQEDDPLHLCVLMLEKNTQVQILLNQQN